MWEDKVVLVTGASQGLGFAISEAFARRGAQVVMVARSAETLQQAAQKLTDAGVPKAPHSQTCDVGNATAVAEMIAAVVAKFGRLDVLVNNVGQSARQDVLETSPEQFQELLNTNLITTVTCTLAALPHLEKTKGHVVNIGSLASRLALRYMGAYPAAKFAVAAYSQQLRLALQPQGIHVLLVMPGPIQRDKPRQYASSEESGIPDAANKPGGGAKTKAISPQQLAVQIVAACERRQAELITPGKARLLMIAGQISPRLGDWLLKKFSGG